MEHDVQAAFFSWVERVGRVEYPPLAYAYAVPNGGARHPAVAVRMKAEGVRAGVLDTALDYPSKGYHGARVEFKYGKNGLSKEQKAEVEWLKSNGYAVHVAWSWEEAARFYLDYLGAPQADIDRLVDGYGAAW